MRVAEPTAIKEFLKTWGLLAVVAAAGFVVTYQYISVHRRAAAVAGENRHRTDGRGVP